MKLVELQQALRAVDSAAVLVAPRILERVIQQVLHLPSLSWKIPHRHCYVVDRHVLFRHVEAEELQLDPDQPLPPTLILLARPPLEELSSLERETSLLKYWRRLFHASVHRCLEIRFHEGKLTAADIAERIQEIGQTEFDEIRAVLVGEHFLLATADDRAVYTEFAAVYLDLRHFAINLLPVYFPGVRDFENIDRLLARDLDADKLFAKTRLAGAPDPVVRIDNSSDESPDHYWDLVRTAERAALAGNTVRAAILRTRAARVAPAALTPSTRGEAEAGLHQLVKRLQLALQLSDAEVAEWQKVLPTLLEKADQGKRPVEAVLLYDLQNVCLDHERDIYALDPVEWLLSGGKRPIKRPLPSQRLVRILQNLRSADQRLNSARLSEIDRQHLSRLLRSVLQRTEEQLRARFRPVLTDALLDVGMQPANPPEATAFHKLVEELLDRIADHGFLNFSDLRDAISRNQLKMPDLGEPQEFIRGDPLLRLDRRLATLLDGVYRRGTLYMRSLERFTALNFGTATGRWLTWRVTIPFGGALVCLEGIQVLLEKFGLPVPLFGPLTSLLPAKDDSPPAMPLMGILAFLALGLFFLGLVQVEPFRRRCAQALRGLYQGTRRRVIEATNWIIRNASLRWLMTSWPFQLFYGYLFQPVLVCAVLWAVLPRNRFGPLEAAGAFLSAVILLNSRLGRAVGETLVQGVIDFYELLRAGLLQGLFTWVLRVFRQILDLVDYVLFSVDEWLQFRRGDSKVSLAARTLLSLFWFPIGYVARFYVVVLIEPGFNPIKAPISILAAKIVYPLVLATMGDPFQQLREARGVGQTLWLALVFSTAWLLPDVFGFLFWEIKENWLLYQANRRPTVRPVVVGAHGEKVRQLLQPGFHSGTVPRLYSRLRLAEREAYKSGNWRGARKCRRELQEVERSLKLFVTREMISLLAQSKSMAGHTVSVGRVALASNRITVELAHAEFAHLPLRIEFGERAGWLVAGILDAGWLTQMSLEQRPPLSSALGYLYKLAGIDLVREQVRADLPPGITQYQIASQGLVVQLEDSGQTVVYDLGDPSEQLKGRTLEGLEAPAAPVMEAARLIFARVPLYWQKWVEVWQKDQAGQGHPRPFTLEVPLLPQPEEVKPDPVTPMVPTPVPAVPSALSEPDGERPELLQA